MTRMRSTTLPFPPSRSDALRKPELAPGLWFFGSGLAIGLVYPLLVMATPDTGRSSAWALAALVSFWSGWRLAWLIGVGEPRLFQFTFWLFTYLWMGLAPMSQLLSDTLPTTTPGLNPSLDQPAMLVVIVGIVAFEGAGLVRSAWLSNHTRERAAREPRQISQRKASILALVGLVFAVYYISRVGLEPLFSSRMNLDMVRNGLWPDPTTEALIVAASSMPLLVALHGLTRARRVAAGRGDPRRGGLLLLLTSITLFVVLNPISNARYVAGTAAFSVLVLLGAFETPRRIRMSMAAIIVSMLVLFPIADAFRYDQVTLKQVSPLTQFQGSGDYDAYAQIHNTVNFITTRGDTAGQQALGVALFWVPRSVWATKPTDTGVLLAASRGYGFTNLSAPLWAEFLINGGLLLVFLGFLPIGWGLRTWDVAAARGFLHNGIAAVVGAIFPFYMIIVLRGSLLQATGYAVALGASSWFIAARRASADFPNEVVPSSTAKASPLLRQRAFRLPVGRQ